jgi:hypothetical protein
VSAKTQGLPLIAQVEVKINGTDKGFCELKAFNTDSRQEKLIAEFDYPE